MRQRLPYYYNILFAAILLLSLPAFAQKNIKQFRVKDNVMYITLSKNLPRASLDSFLTSYNLVNIGLHMLFKSGKTDSINKSDWTIQDNGKSYITLTKKIGSGTDVKSSAGMITFASIPTPDNWRIVGGNKIVYGVNKFKSNHSFRQKDDVTYFYIKGYKNARSVKLAGNFTNWQDGAFPMTKTGDGWIAPVRLSPGKYYYKFIINNDDWITDPANNQNENDGMGNTNSVYVVPNKTFTFKGYENAKTVSLIANFNNWSKDDIKMEKTEGGWRKSLYLQQGTWYYKFLVDGKLVVENEEKKSDNEGKKLSVGKYYTFILKGFKNAHKVSVAGDFNDWKPGKILMEPVQEGWKVSYAIGPGNYQYKYIVDGNWVTDPANPNIVDDGKGNLNSFMVVSPNYTFRLKGHPRAKRVFLAGEFNNWSQQGLAMIKSGDEWTCPVYLAKGKHLYKFIIDGRWVRDPQNPLWEDGDENSVLWIE